MIIDSHAHYAHEKFDVEIPYLCGQNGEYRVRRAAREDLLAEMQKNNIVGFIEPSIGFHDIEKQMRFVKDHSDCVWGAIGIHPTRCIHTDWENREKLSEYAETNAIIAIGETGLDYHTEEVKAQSDIQKQWFRYQIELADRLRLPLVLHIRMADEDALEILKEYKVRLHGGAVHCFSEDPRIAEEYISLGFAIGIGAKLFAEEEGRALRETVRRVPLESLLAETDAPFVLPDIDQSVCRGNARKKLCNSSMILPMVIEKIAELRGELRETVEDTLYRNTLRTFRL